MIEDVVRYLKAECPVLAGKEINVNFLKAAPGEFSVDPIPCDPIIRKYPDGGFLGQFQFVLASRELYDAGEEQLDVCAFYEAFSRWVEEVNRKGDLPRFSDGSRAVRFSVTAGGYLFSNTAASARYQMQCRLIYEKEGVFDYE